MPDTNSLNPFTKKRHQMIEKIGYKLFSFPLYDSESTKGLEGELKNIYAYYYK